jgi:RNA polymerase sigma-70 factor, ECF subfamily
MPNGDLTRLFQTVRPGGASKRLTGGAGPSSRSGHGDLLNFAIQKEVRLGETESPTPPAEREDELLEGCRAGDLEAFEKLYQTNGPRMKSIALNLLGNVGDAEDAVQEAFLKIFRGAKAFRGGAAFSTWTYRVLVNTCYDALRRRKSRPVAGPLGASGGEVAVAADPVADPPLRLALEKAVARLDPRHRAVFLLFSVEGFTHGEIARILGIPEGTSKTFLFEAKRKLQRWLGTLPRAAGVAS